MAIIQISKIQVRSGNLVDLPQLDEAELGWASDNKRLFIGKTTPNENIEILTSYSNIDFSQLTGSYGNLNISNPVTGQVLVYDQSSNAWLNAGGNASDPGEPSYWSSNPIHLGNVSTLKIGGGAIGYILETDGTGNLNWTPKGVISANISAATKANPVVITTSADNFFTDADLVTITNVSGMTQLNGNSYYANVLTSNTFSLYSDSALTVPVDGTGYGTYTGNGRAVASVGGSGGGGGGAGGSTYSVQYNYAGVPTGDASFTWNNTTSTLTVTGTSNVTGNLNVTGNVAASRLVSNVATGTAPLVVTSTTQVANLSVATAGSAGTVTTNAQPNITSVGTLTSLIVSGQATVGGYALISGYDSQVGIKFPGGSSRYGLAMQPTTDGTSIATFFNAANGVVGSITQTASNVTFNGLVAGSNITGQVGNALVAGTVYTNAQPNITSVGTLTTLSVSGNANVGNLGTAQVFASANITAPQLISNVATGTAPLVVTSTTQVANLSVATAGSATTAGTVTTNAQPNITSVGTLTTLSVSGNANIGNVGATLFVGNISGSGNSNVGNLGTGLITASGNITGTSILASRFVQSPYSIVAPEQIINPGTGALTIITTAIASGTVPYYVATDPTGRFVYTTNAFDNSISQYSINQTTGALTSITTAIASGTQPRTLVVDPTGRFVYAVNNTSNTVSQYSIDQTTGALTSITTAIASGTTPWGIAVDPTGRFVYVTNSGSNTISQYSINQTTGALTSITTAIASGTTPYGIAVDPTGRFVYAVNNAGNTVSQYSIDQTTGALTSITTAIASGTTPWGIAVDPTGRFVYVVNNNSNTISQYSINQTTGALTLITTAIAIGPIGIAIDPTGRFVYVTSFGSNVVYQYSINQTTGALTSGTTLPLGGGIYGISVDPTSRFLYVVLRNSGTVGQYNINNFSTGSMTVAGNLNVTNTIVGNITSLTTGANTTAGSITGNWTLTTGSRLQATYADLAEYYEADQLYEAGTVLMFGGEKEVTVAEDGTTKVAGVVSTDPAYLMNSNCPGHKVAIALQGRVPVKVRGRIRKGDLMVSAGNGFARPWNNASIGMIIGKSIQDFDGVEGIVEVAVGRL